MEPTRESIAAPRRQLTEAEKDTISQAVMLKLGDSAHRDFKWFPLVIRSHDQLVDYCGLVSGEYVVGEYNIQNYDAEFREYYAQLTIDRRGSLSKVNIVSIGNSRSENIPTRIDSICIQDGYNVPR
jgi:hypothetical protein